MSPARIRNHARCSGERSSRSADSRTAYRDIVRARSSRPVSSYQRASRGAVPNVAGDCSAIVNAAAASSYFPSSRYTSPNNDWLTADFGSSATSDRAADSAPIKSCCAKSAEARTPKVASLRPSRRASEARASFVARSTSSELPVSRARRRYRAARRERSAALSGSSVKRRSKSAMSASRTVASSVALGGGDDGTS